jgi:hypothetical protein
MVSFTSIHFRKCLQLVLLYIYVVTGRIAVSVTQGKRPNALSHGLHHQAILCPRAADMVQRVTDDASNQQRIEQPRLVSWHWYLF